MRTTPALDKYVAYLVEHGVSTPQEIADAFGVTAASIRSCFRASQERNESRVYIKDWQRAEWRGDWAPLWAVGDKPNKPPPKPIPSIERKRAFRKRNRAKIRAAQRSTPVTWITGL